MKIERIRVRDLKAGMEMASGESVVRAVKSGHFQNVKMFVTLKNGDKCRLASWAYWGTVTIKNGEKP